MAFCKFCGKQLEEGEVCNCKETATPAPASNESTKATQTVATTATVATATASPKTTSATMNKVKDVLIDTWKYFCLVIKNPIEGCNTYVKKDSLPSMLIFLALQTIFSGFFALVTVAKLSDSMFEMSKAKGFFLTLLYSVLYSAVLALLYFIAAKVSNINIKFFRAVSIISVRSIVMTPFLILSTIVMLMSTKFGISLLVIGIFTSICFLVQASKNMDEVSQARAMYINIIIIAIYFAIFVLLAGKLSNTYLPSDISKLLNGANIFDL